MLRLTDKSPHQTKASCRAAKALRPVLIGTSLCVAASAFAALPLVSSASADDANYKILGWDWKFQKYRMASSLDYCGKNAPLDPNAPPGKADHPWTKVLETIQAAAEKWKYSSKDSTIFQFKFAGGDCPRCPTLNYIEFATLKDPAKPAESSYPQVSGTTNMRECAIRFNSAVSWYVGEGVPKSDQYDLFSVALHEFGHCVGLDDITTGTAVMSAGLKPGDTRRDLKQGDIDGRKAIYGGP